MSALNQITSANLIAIINGKLVMKQSNELDYVNSQMTDISQKIDGLEVKIIAAESLDRKEYINQLKRLKISIQKLENSYQQLLWVMVAFGITSTFLLGWMVFQ